MDIPYPTVGLCPLLAFYESRLDIAPGPLRVWSLLPMVFDGFVFALHITCRRFDSGSEDCITVFSTS